MVCHAQDNSQETLQILEVHPSFSFGRLGVALVMVGPQSRVYARDVGLVRGTPAEGRRVLVPVHVLCCTTSVALILPLE